MNENLFTLAILCFLVALAIQFEKTKLGKQISASLIVIILGAIFSNLNLIPSSSNSIPLYDIIFVYVTPLSLFFLLLDVNISSLRKAGLPILILFIMGSLGTMLGVMVAHFIVYPEEQIGELAAPLAGMITGTYTGGSINFSTLAIHYKLQEQPVLMAGTMAVDNILTTIWMIVTITIPLLLKGTLKIKPNTKTEEYKLRDKIGPDLESSGFILFLGMGSMVISVFLQDFFEGIGLTIPSILILTTIALLIAQTNIMKRFQGAYVLGTLGLYLFLAVIGAFCDISALTELKDIGYTLLIYLSIVLLVHGLFIFGLGLLIWKDPEMIAIASQANIGGASTALALSRSWKRNDLMVAAMLIGSLGTAIGSYLGFMMVWFLQ